MNLANKLGIALVTSGLIASAAMLEGTRYVPYLDIVKVWTVCEGYTGPGVQRDKLYTRAECDVITTTQLAKHGAEVLECVNVPIAQHEYEAYTLFAFNVGGPAFCRSTLLKKLNQGDHVGACDGLLAWDYAGGQRVAGLQKRRQFERRMCRGELQAPTPTPQKGK